MVKGMEVNLFSAIKNTDDQKPEGQMDKFSGKLQDEWKPEDETKTRNKKITVSLLRMKLEEQEFRCVYSGRELTPDACSLDHITPLSKGGLHVIDNIQFVCPMINRMKNTMSSEEFIAICRMVARYSIENQ